MKTILHDYVLLLLKPNLWRIPLVTAFIVLWVISVAPPVSTTVSASEGAPFTEEQFEALSKLISKTPLKKMGLEFFKDVYRTPHAPDMLKRIFGQPIHLFPAKNRRLGNLRKWYDWSIQADYARNKNVVIENTNQGKDNGARSDLDATANILEFDWTTGKYVIRDKTVADLIEYQTRRYKSDHLSPDGVDVTLFNGDTWLPDWRDSRMSYQEFTRKMLSNIWDLKNRKGAYFVPGAHKEQPHDRALAEGHSIHIGWDYIKNGPTVNGRLIEFDYQEGEIVDAESKEPIQEYATREMAKKGVVRRYEGVEVLEEWDRWHRSLGNVVQNAKEFLTHEEPITRNKYFIERVIDQGVGRFTHLNGHSYVEIHGSAMPDAEKNGWKKAFIQQAFGIPESDSKKIEEIQSVLDRSSEIQLDKTKERAGYSNRRQDYYKEELKEAEENVKKKLEAKGQQPGADFEELKLKEAERIFVEKQRNIMIEGGVRVIEESFRRDFTPEGMRRWNRSNFDSLTRKKIMFERGMELALLLDILETAPRLTRAERDALRQRVINAIPDSAKSLVAKLAEINGLKLRLVGRIGFERWTKTGDGISDIRPTELIAQIAEEMQRLLGGDVDSKPPSGSDDAARKAIFGTIYDHLGPVERESFQRAWEAGKHALIAKFGASAYWNEIKNQMDFLMVTGAALGLINAYQQHCASQTTVLTEDCLSGLGWETASQTLYMLPGINTGFLILSGLKAINEGNPEGFVTLGLGTASLPSVSSLLGVSGAAVIHLYIAYQIVKTGYAVAVGYMMQTLESDALEQAFKAIPEPGKQARRYNYPNQPTLSRADTPTLPLLSDVIQVEADQWDADKQYRVAKEQFAPSIEQELKELGLKPETDDWYTKRYEIIQRYADALPYTQRMAKIYEVFSPTVERLIIDLRKKGRSDVGESLIGLRTCLDVREAKVEAKYKAPPSLWNRLRFWRDDQKDKQQESNQVWSKCIQETAKEDLEILNQVFSEYVHEWFLKQSDGYGGYRSTYDTPDFRTKLIYALINEYIVRRHLDLGYEAERQMKKAAQAARELAEARIKLMGNLLQAQEDTQNAVQKKLEQAAEDNYRGDPPEELAAKPEIKLTVPSYAVQLGEPAQIDFAARGMYYSEDKLDGVKSNTWKASIQSGIVKVILAQPSNLVMTKALEDELKVEPGKQPRRFVAIDEKLMGELKDDTEKKLASAETTVHYYDLLPKWSGHITVEVRAAGPETRDLSTPRRDYAYAGAVVKLSGPAQDQKESEWRSADYASAYFRNLPAGGFSIHVAPKPDDKLHSAVDATVVLSDYVVVWPKDAPEENQDGTVFTLKRLDKDQDGSPVEKEMILVQWKDADSITVVLPYVPPPKTEEPKDPKACLDNTREALSGLQGQLARELNQARNAASRLDAARKRAADVEQGTQEIDEGLQQFKPHALAWEQECAKATPFVQAFQSTEARIDQAANRIMLMRELAKNLAGVACELADRAKQETDSTKASNLAYSSGQFAKQTQKQAEEARQLAEETKNAYDAAVEQSKAIEQLDTRAGDLRRDFAALSDRRQKLREGLVAATAEAAQGDDALAEANAAATEAERLVGALMQLLQPCDTIASGKSSFQNTIQVAEGMRQAVYDRRNWASIQQNDLHTRLQHTTALTTSADAVAGALQQTLTSCDNLTGATRSAGDAQAAVDTIEVFAKAAQESAKTAEDCSSNDLVGGVLVPDLAVLTNVAEIKTALQHAGLALALVAASEKTPSKEKEFKVQGQSPPPNTKVKRGTTVTVAIYHKFEGVDKEVVVPNLAMFDNVGEIKAVLQRAGLTPAFVVASVPSPSKEKEFKVQGQSPAPDTKVKRGTTVTVAIYPKYAPPDFDLSGQWTLRWNWSVTDVDFVGSVTGSENQWAFEGSFDSVRGNVIWRPAKGSGKATCTLTNPSGVKPHIKCTATFAQGKFEDGKWKEVIWEGEADGTIEARSYGDKRKFVYAGRGRGTADGGARAGIDHLDLAPKMQ